MNNFHATGSGCSVFYPETAGENIACFKLLTKYQPVQKKQKKSSIEWITVK
jgi:hypothetical protein